MLGKGIDGEKGNARGCCTFYYMILCVLMLGLGTTLQDDQGPTQIRTTKGL